MGPNKLRFKGVLQPVFDGIKLFLKEIVLPVSRIFNLFFLGPIVSFLVILIIWLLIKEIFYFFNLKILIIFFLILLGLSVYSTLLAGWRSVSKFASLGRIRSCRQSISYEVGMALFFISIILFYCSIKIRFFSSFGNYLILFPIFIIWFLSCIAETNRAPFDFREGERELISGFNIEFGAITFTLLFLAEYGIIIFFSIFSSFLFFSINLFIRFLIVFVFILIRSVFPRFRYDKLIKITWFYFLPCAIFFCLISYLL